MMLMIMVGNLVNFHRWQKYWL